MSSPEDLRRRSPPPETHRRACANSRRPCVDPTRTASAISINSLGNQVRALIGQSTSNMGFQKSGSAGDEGFQNRFSILSLKQGLADQRINGVADNHPAIPSNTNTLARTLTAMVSHATTLGSLAAPRLRLIKTTIAIRVDTGVTATNQAANASATSQWGQNGIGR